MSSSIHERRASLDTVLSHHNPDLIVAAIYLAVSGLTMAGAALLAPESSLRQIQEVVAPPLAVTGGVTLAQYIVNCGITWYNYAR